MDKITQLIVQEKLIVLTSFVYRGIQWKITPRKITKKQQYDIMKRERHIYNIGLVKTREREREREL